MSQSPERTTHNRPNSAWTTVDGLRIHADTFGDRHEGDHDRPTIVLLHGLGVSNRYLLPTARLLSKDFFVVAPELPGTGKSDSPDEALDLAGLARALDGWMLAFGISRAAFLCSSMGCQVIAELALRVPERIESIVFVGPTSDPRWRSIGKQIPRWLLEAAREPLKLLPTLVDDYVGFGPRRFWKTANYALEDRLEEKLPFIKVPTLVVRGENDAFVSRAWVETIAGLLPRGRAATVPHAAHAANYSNAEGLADLARPFFFEARGSGCKMRHAGPRERPERVRPRAGVRCENTKSLGRFASFRAAGRSLR